MCGPYLFASVKELTDGFTWALYAESCLAALGLALVTILRKTGGRQSAQTSRHSG